MNISFCMLINNQMTEKICDFVPDMLIYKQVFSLNKQVFFSVRLKLHYVFCFTKIKIVRIGHTVLTKIQISFNAFGLDKKKTCFF